MWLLLRNGTVLYKSDVLFICTASILLTSNPSIALIT